MKRRVSITGIGLVSGLGTGLDALWQGLLSGQSSIQTITAFDASGFPCQVAAASPTAQIKDFVPKSYRKATKVMARDIELAVIAADLAARHAGLVTPANCEDTNTAGRTYEAERTACHIGASLIAAELDELTYALNKSAQTPGMEGKFDIHHWGREGMQNLTPLWLLKYLPNMLACHVTIVHDSRGPSNTITCAEASGGLSLGESLRVIQRGSADCGFCGGATAKLNPMAYIREVFTGRLTTENANPTSAVRPFDTSAGGMVIGDGGSILILEANETLEKRGGKAVAEVAGFGASQSLNRANRNTTPTADGRGVRLAIEAALRDAGISASEIDFIIPNGLGHAASDQAEAAALRSVFGEGLAQVPVLSPKAAIGNTVAGSAAMDVGIAAKCLAEGVLPPILNRSSPLPGFGATQSKRAPQYALCVSSGLCGQNAAVVLKKA